MEELDRVILILVVFSLADVYTCSFVLFNGNENIPVCRNKFSMKIINVPKHKCACPL